MIKMDLSVILGLCPKPRGLPALENLKNVGKKRLENSSLNHRTFRRYHTSIPRSRTSALLLRFERTIQIYRKNNWHAII